MKKIGLLVLILILVLPLILAINVTVEQKTSSQVMIVGLKNPAVFNLEVTNNGPSDNFKFFNLLGFSMEPKETISIRTGDTKEVELIVYPKEKFDNKNFYTLTYLIKGQDNSEQTEKVTIKIVELEDAFEVGSGEFNLDDNSLNIYIYNKENFTFENLTVRFKSAFFDFEDSFTLGPNEKKDFSVGVEKEDIKKLMAGFYTMSAEISVGDLDAEIEGVIKFVEKDLLTTTKKDYGLIFNTQIIKKVNEGNVVAKSETLVKKNIISRLFASFSPEPDIVERKGVKVYYTWNREINPGESLEIIVRTNWLFPLIVILFIVAIVILARQYSKTNLILRKKVSFVNTKGGEFALKVTLFVRAKNYLERVSIIDRLPPLVKVHERFGSEQPVRVDEKTKRIEWQYEKLEAGEVRVISYIIYSKVGVLGKFALPSTTAIFEKDGKIQEAQSNRAFFIAEQRKDEIEEE